MTGILNIFNHVERQKRYQNHLSTAFAAPLPSVSSYDEIPIAYVALRGTGGTWERIPTGEYSGIQVIISKADGTQLAFQNTFTPNADGYTYEGVLSCGDPLFVTAVSALTLDNPLAVYFSVRFVDSDGNFITAVPPTRIDAYKSPFTAATPTVPPEETALTQSYGNNTYVKRDGSSGPSILISPSGNRFIFSIDDVGQPVFTPV
jgi:hypothetical protein